MKKSFKKKFVSSRLTLAGYVERMGDEKLPQRAGKGGEEDRNCDGDCIKRDLVRVGEEWEKEQQIEGNGHCLR